MTWNYEFQTFGFQTFGFPSFGSQTFGFSSFGSQILDAKVQSRSTNANGWMQNWLAKADQALTKQANG